MNDKKMIITGLAIFLFLFTLPIWYNLVSATSAPEPELSAKAKAAKAEAGVKADTSDTGCVRSKEYMVAEHMQLLDVWRDTVVRTGERIYASPNGKQYNMSLSTGENSCLGCHVSKADFCDKCHNYTSVDPYCWDCHIDPKEKK